MSNRQAIWTAKRDDNASSRMNKLDIVGEAPFRVDLDAPPVSVADFFHRVAMERKQFRRTQKLQPTRTHRPTTAVPKNSAAATPKPVSSHGFASVLRPLPRPTGRLAAMLSGTVPCEQDCDAQHTTEWSHELFKLRRSQGWRGGAVGSLVPGASDPTLLTTGATENQTPSQTTGVSPEPDAAPVRGQYMVTPAEISKWRGQFVSMCFARRMALRFDCEAYRHGKVSSMVLTKEQKEQAMRAAKPLEVWREVVSRTALGLSVKPKFKRSAMEWTAYMLRTPPLKRVLTFMDYRCCERVIEVCGTVVATALQDVVNAADAQITQDTTPDATASTQNPRNGDVTTQDAEDDTKAMQSDAISTQNDPMHTENATKEVTPTQNSSAEGSDSTDLSTLSDTRMHAHHRYLPSRPRHCLSLVHRLSRWMYCALLRVADYDVFQDVTVGSMRACYRAMRVFLAHPLSAMSTHTHTQTSSPTPTHTDTDITSSTSPCPDDSVVVLRVPGASEREKDDVQLLDNGSDGDADAGGGGGGGSGGGGGGNGVQISERTCYNAECSINEGQPGSSSTVNESECPNGGCIQRSESIKNNHSDSGERPPVLIYPQPPCQCTSSGTCPELAGSVGGCMLLCTLIRFVCNQTFRDELKYSP